SRVPRTRAARIAIDRVSEESLIRRWMRRAVHSTGRERARSRSLGSFRRLRLELRRQNHGVLAAPARLIVRGANADLLEADGAVGRKSAVEGESADDDR